MSIDIDTFDCGDVGMNNVTLTVTDTDGLTTSCTAFVEVIDDGGDAVISCPDDFTASIPVGTTYELLDYQDEIKIRLHNPNNDKYHIVKGNRIAQITLLEHKSYLFGIDTEDERVGGFGSSGGNDE